jgi:hypothetical protein
MNKKVHILGGGTLAYVRSHLALCAPAYGTTARKLERLCRRQGDKLDVVLHLTRMAGGNKELETVEDVARLLDEIVAHPATKIVFVNVALCDFRGIIGDERDCHKHGTRLSTRSEPIPRQMELRPLPKLIGTIRRHRKDIFLVGFKHTSGATPDEQYVAGLHLVKEASCNLVQANDTVTRWNMVVTPEEARYHATTDRDEALRGLVEMAYLRSHLTFTRSTVVAGEPVPWDSRAGAGGAAQHAAALHQNSLPTPAPAPPGGTSRERALVQLSLPSFAVARDYVAGGPTPSFNYRPARKDCPGRNTGRSVRLGFRRRQREWSTGVCRGGAGSLLPRSRRPARCQRRQFLDPARRTGGCARRQQRIRWG